MNRFILKTLVFVIVTVCSILFLFVCTNLSINKLAKFKLERVNHVIIGHSRPECAFNDSLINNFKNMSQSGESYFYSYQKVKKIISQNKNIKNVFIEFSNNQIDSEVNNWIWGEQYIKEKSYYLPFLDKEDIGLLWRKNKNGLIAGSSKSFRNNVMNLLLLRFDYTKKTGGYLWLDRFKTDSLIASIKINKSLLNKKTGQLSITNIKYLEKIVVFCRSSKVNMFFVRSPQHIYSHSRKNEKAFIKIKNEKFNTVEFLDFNDFPLTNNEFGDFGHLNYKGAKKFSVWFNQLLSKGLLTKHNKKAFISSEINKL